MKPSNTPFFSALSSALKSNEPLLTVDDVMNIIDSNDNIFKAHVNAFFVMHSFSYRRKKMFYLSYFRLTNDYNDVLAVSCDWLPSLYEMFDIGMCEASVYHWLKNGYKHHDFPILLTSF